MTPEEIEQLKQRLAQMEGPHMPAFNKAIPHFEAFHETRRQFLATSPLAFGERKALKARMQELKEKVQEVEVKVSAAFPEAYAYLPDLDCTIPEYKVFGLLNDSSIVAAVVVFILAFFWGKNESGGDLVYSIGFGLGVTVAITALTIAVPMITGKNKKK